jgi:uncharacterized protein YbjT (DUF2867 family)
MDPVGAPELTAIAPKKVLVLGGTGRVGSATAASLAQLTPGHTITLAGRDTAKHAALTHSRPELAHMAFAPVDIYDFDVVRDAARGQDLVVHAAGPFQRREDVTALRACALHAILRRTAAGGRAHRWNEQTASRPCMAPRLCSYNVVRVRSPATPPELVPDPTDARAT